MVYRDQPIVLASGSPRRTELLQVAGIAHEIDPADIDEQLNEGEPAADYVVRMACEKATVVAQRYPQRIVLGADTTVVLNRHILGKPRDRLQAVQFLRLLSGGTHQVMTAVAVAFQTADQLQLKYKLQTSRVNFLRLSDRQISDYVATGEPLDKAGGYAIQGRGATLVEHLSGSFSGVMGLPLAETVQLLGLFQNQIQFRSV